VTSSSESQQSSQQSGGGAKEARRKANQRIGQWINRKYCLESLLGVGGMATVYATRHRNGSRCALKILHAEFAREEGVKTRFLREGYVANKVDHPGAVRILDDDETEQGEPFLVMELLEGETLQQLWKRHKRKVPAAEAMRICGAVLDTLQPYHDLNIIHRDLKPANIFICHDTSVKLLDFGVAQMREGGEALTRAGTALGTPSFMSPEQAMGKSDQLDGRSDVFAVGATLYAILSGKRLHHGKSDNEAFILAATQPAPSLARVAPDLQPEVHVLVDTALQWDRRKRFGSAADMRDACNHLAQQLGGPGGTVAPVPPPPQPQRSATPVPNATPPPQQQALPPVAPPRVASTTLSQSAPPPQHTPHGGIRVERGSRGAPPPPPRRPTPAPTPPAAAAATPEEPVADHPALGLFERLDKALPTLRHYGLDHPEGAGRLRAIHAATIDVLREMPTGVVFQVHPFCFSDGPTTLWEPGPPYDQIPYGMVSSGVESVTIKVGVTEDEVRAFIKAVVVDPQRELTEGSIGAALWEADLKHIDCTIREDMAANDAREQMRFFSESEQLEASVIDQLAAAMAQTGAVELNREDEAELRAMALTTDTESFKASQQATAVLSLDQTTASALAAQLSVDANDWRERFFDVAADALTDATMRQDPEILYGNMRDYAHKMVRAGMWGTFLDTYDKLRDRVTAGQRTDARAGGPSTNDIAQQIFGTSLVESAFAALEQTSNPLDEAITERLTTTLTSVLPILAGDMVQTLLARASGMPPGPLKDLALSYVERHIQNNQQLVMDMVDQLQPELAQHMLGLVSKSLGDAATDMLKPLLMSSNLALRCEATALLSESPDQLGKQLVHLLGSAETALRSAALTTMKRHQVRQAGPGLVSIIEGERFRSRSAEEQRQTLDTLYGLNPTRAESLLTGIVKQHGMLADDKLDAMRIAAAETLGAHADSITPLDVLEDAARLRPWNTQSLRAAATAAVSTIRDRLHKAEGSSA